MYVVGQDDCRKLLSSEGPQFKDSLLRSSAPSQSCSDIRPHLDDPFQRADLGFNSVLVLRLDSWAPASSFALAFYLIIVR